MEDTISRLPELIARHNERIPVLFNPNPGTLQKLHKGVTRAKKARALKLCNYCNCRHTGFCLAYPVSFLAQALNPSTRFWYFVMYGRA